MKALSQQMWPRLETLMLDCCNVAPAGAAVLATGRWLPALRRLALEDNTLGDAGTMALARGTWPRLEELSLSDSDRSANVETRPSMRVLVEAAQQWPAFRRLDNFGPNIDLHWEFPAKRSRGA